MGLFNLVQQDHAVGAAPDEFGQAAAVVIADVAGRRADDAADGVPFLVLRHIEPDQGFVIVEEVLGQRLGQLRLADAGRADEEEVADRSLGVLQTSA